VGFNIMHPDSKLSMHYGMVSKYVRFHLGIKCDTEAKFIVNKYAPRAWENGKVWAFDDGDAYHGTVHNGTETRVILIVDIDRAAFAELKEEITWG
jgi:aspartyl/asparaginyl beta-hydroxylase (cupin superfamily)